MGGPRETQLSLFDHALAELPPTALFRTLQFSEYAARRACARVRLSVLCDGNGKRGGEALGRLPLRAFLTLTLH